MKFLIKPKLGVINKNRIRFIMRLHTLEIPNAEVLQIKFNLIT